MIATGPTWGRPGAWWDAALGASERVPSSALYTTLANLVAVLDAGLPTSGDAGRLALSRALLIARDRVDALAALLDWVVDGVPDLSEPARVLVARRVVEARRLDLESGPLAPLAALADFALVDADLEDDDAVRIALADLGNALRVVHSVRVALALEDGETPR